jgi:ubiquinone/menaquinone biosynthesis C-methylase UbiE
MELRIAESAGVSRGCEVLDVGCGIGGTACHLAQATGARVHGLTPNAVQLELARAHAQELQLEGRVRFVRGSAEALPFDDASFDVVLFFESACHFPDRARFFREARRVLRPGGRLAGEDWLAAHALGTPPCAAHVERICETWAIPALGTLAEYAQQMREAGLEVLESVDLRDEMALLRGFLVGPEDRAQVQREIEACREPIRRQIMQALLILGAAAAEGAFTVGRFVAQRR